MLRNGQKCASIRYTMKCQNCGEPFPSRVRINGRIRNLGHRKFCLKCSPFGAHRTRHPNHQTLPEKKLCKRCNTIKERNDFYTRRNGSALFPYCIACVGQEVADRQRETKLKAVEYKGGECLLCGYHACPAAMDFHHTDPNEKDFSISHVKNASFNDTFKKELDKCVLLCARCHREVEDGFSKLPTEGAPPAGLEPA